MKPRKLAIIALFVACVVALPGCKIVRIGDTTAAESKGASAADRAAKLWAEKAPQYLVANAHPISDVLPAMSADLGAAGAKYGKRQGAEGSPWTFIVSGSGTVRQKKTESRAGTLIVTIDGTASPTEATLQIGPVVRGNAIRDSLPFVSFEDFDNQLDFADMGRALNALAMKAIEPGSAVAEPEKKIEFVGVISLSSASDHILVTPSSLKVAQ